MILIGILAILLVVTTISSQSYVKKASASSESCPAGQLKDWLGICFNKSQAKACPTCAPGSAAAAEKHEASARVEANKEVEKPTVAEAEKPKSTAAEKSETLAHVEAKDLFSEGTKLKQQQLGNSVIKVENQTAGTGTLHTKESAHQQALASRVKVEHAPTTPATPTAPTSHTKTTKFALLGNRHLGMLTEEPDVGQGNGPFPLLGSGNGPCPTGKVRDYAGYCFNAREAKACFTCPPGSTLAGQRAGTCTRHRISTPAGTGIAREVSNNSN